MCLILHNFPLRLKLLEKRIGALFYALLRRFSRQIDRGETPATSKIGRLKIFGDLIDLHIVDMCEVSKAPGQSKAATLKMLKTELSECKIVELDRDCLSTQTS